MNLGMRFDEYHLQYCLENLSSLLDIIAFVVFD